MKKFEINQGTLDLVREKLSSLRDTTNSRGEHVELITLLKVLTNLPLAFSEADLAARRKAQQDKLDTSEFIKKYVDCIKPVEPLKLTAAEIKRSQDLLDRQIEKSFLGSIYGHLSSWKAQTNTSSLVGKRVRRSDSDHLLGPNRSHKDLPIGTILQQLSTGEVIVDFNSATGRPSHPLKLSQLEILP